MVLGVSEELREMRAKIAILEARDASSLRSLAKQIEQIAQLKSELENLRAQLQKWRQDN